MTPSHAGLGTPKAGLSSTEVTTSLVEPLSTSLLARPLSPFLSTSESDVDMALRRLPTSPTTLLTLSLAPFSFGLDGSVRSKRDVDRERFNLI